MRFDVGISEIFRSYALQVEDSVFQQFNSLYYRIVGAYRI